MADEPNSDSIRKVVEHHYFQTLLENQVKSQTNTYVNRWWKTITAIATVVLAILGAFGITGYLSFTNQITELKKETENAKALANESMNLLRQAQELANNARATVALADKYIQSSQTIAENTGSLAEKTGKFTENLLASLSQREQDLKLSQARLEENIRNSVPNIEAIRVEKERIEQLKDQIALIQRQIDERNRNIAGIETKVAETKDNVDQTYGQVRATVDSLNKTLNFQEELAKAKTFEIVVIRQGSSHFSTVNLPDFREVGSGNQKTFTIKFTAVNIKDQVDIDIHVGDSEEPLTFRRLKKGSVRPIGDTPYVFRVDSIYHAKLAFDFVVLRIDPKPSLTGLSVRAGK